MNPASISRREMLCRTLTGFGYLALGGLAARGATKPAHFQGKAKRVILLYMQGGVSHLDTFDYKPKLQANHGKDYATGKGGKLIGSPWKFAQHGQSGQWVSELLPHVGRHADELCVLSAMHTDAQAHETAVPMFHPGNQLQSRPSLGAWVLYGLGAETNDLPDRGDIRVAVVQLRAEDLAFANKRINGASLEMVMPRGQTLESTVCHARRRKFARLQLTVVATITAARIRASRFNFILECFPS